MRTSQTKTPSLQHLLKLYECGAVQFAGDPNASYERHPLFDHVVDPKAAIPRERFEAVARALRDRLAQRWLKTSEAYDRDNPKQVYYNIVPLADLSAYGQAQEQVGMLYQQPKAWARKAILNVGHSGKFSSDRTIAEYTAHIWKVKPCPVG